MGICTSRESPHTHYDSSSCAVHSGKEKKGSSLQGEIGRERCHDFAKVWLDNATKSRNGSRNGLFAQEAENSENGEKIIETIHCNSHDKVHLPEDTKHSQTTIVDLSNQTPSFRFFRSILAETKGIVKVERYRVRKVFLESREFSRFASCSATK